jgi:hypothetical protein
MKESLQKAKEEIIERWKQSFEDLQNLNQHNDIIYSYKFSKGRAFLLSECYNGKLKADERLYSKYPENSGLCFKHYFDKDGRALITQELSAIDKAICAGYYNWHNDYIEYVEFNLLSGIPSYIQKITFKNGFRDMYQSVYLNGGGNAPVFENMNRLEMIDFVLNNDIMVFNIEAYEIDQNQISRSYGYAKMGMEILTERIYLYDEIGILQQIKTHYDTGGSFVTYVKPTGKSLKNQIDELSVKLSDYLIHILSQHSFDSPLFCVDLSYQYCYTYWPCLSIITSNQKMEALQQQDDSLLFSANFLETTSDKYPVPDDLGLCFAAFKQSIESKNNWEAGRKMLRQTARLMTQNKLKGLVPVTNDFITFPIEWQLEFDELKKILHRCGASKENIKEWTKAGWVKGWVIFLLASL